MDIVCQHQRGYRFVINAFDVYQQTQVHAQDCQTEKHAAQQTAIQSFFTAVCTSTDTSRENQYSNGIEARIQDTGEKPAAAVLRDFQCRNDFSRMTQSACIAQEADQTNAYRKDDDNCTKAAQDICQFMQTQNNCKECCQCHTDTTYIRIDSIIFCQCSACTRNHDNKDRIQECLEQNFKNLTNCMTKIITYNRTRNFQLQLLPVPHKHTACPSKDYHCYDTAQDTHNPLCCKELHNLLPCCKA